MFRFFEKRVDPYPEGEPAPPPRRLLAFLWAGTEGLRPYILLMTLLTAAVAVFEAALFWMLGQVVDWLAAADPATLWRDHASTLLVLAAIVLGSTVLVAGQTMLKHQTLSGNFPMRLRWNFHRLMLGQSMGFYQDEFAGRVSAKVMQTALAVRDTVLTLADILVFVTIYFVTMLLIVGSFDPLMLLPFLIWLGLYGATLWWFVPRLARVSENQADARALMTGRITDAYTNIATVKLFSHAGREAAYARNGMDEFLQTVHAQMRLVSAMETLIHLLSMILILSIGGLALWLWSQGQVGVGALAAATAMTLRLNGMSHWIMWEMARLFEQVGTVQDGINTLARPHLVRDQPNAVSLQVTRGEIRFDDLSFAYPAHGGPGRPVIDALDLVIRPGEKIGLVGRSGAGKSTVVSLLLRFFDPQRGRVLIDGQDISQVSQNSLRACIGVVTQDTSLLHRSVRDNIRYGRPEASDGDIIAAARRAEAWGFIEGLSDPAGRQGLDVHVGERGVKLSGGQRQRIAIARVMLKDAPILILDEATSALDSEIETAIQDSLYRLMEGKTVLAIAHRLSTIAAMDRLIVIDQGRIVEQGTHQQLLENGGIYARLWAHQSGGFLAEVTD
ncbi:MAG: ABC transporter ATP-binding protein [Wenzhouxiangella sp.]